MNKYISEKMAINALILLLSLVIVFHILVISGIIPFEIVWGGRLTDSSELPLYESISISLNLLMLFMVLTKAGYLRIRMKENTYRIFFGLMCLLFLVNTVGNIFSKNDLERMIFTPFTLILTVLFLRLAITNKK
jgi:hypothetical protein